MGTFFHVVCTLSAISLAFFALVVSGQRGQLLVQRPDETTTHVVGAWLSCLLVLGALLMARIA